MITREEVLANRLKWAKYLQSDEAMKQMGYLENGDLPNYRCCLGHACHALGISRTVNSVGSVRYGNEHGVAPGELMYLVGLDSSSGLPYGGAGCLSYRDREGCSYESLVEINDGSNATPKQIGAYLESVIEGGEGTPFIPLSEYPEASTDTRNVG